MALTPERLFDLYFNDGRLKRTRLYRGRAKLDQLEGHTLPASLLADLQRAMNEALALEKKIHCTFRTTRSTSITSTPTIRMLSLLVTVATRSSASPFP